MGKAALLAVAAFSVFGAVHAVGLVQGKHDGAVREAEVEYRLLARQAARAGLARAHQAIVDDFADAYDYAGTTLTGTFDGVDYEAVIGVESDTATVRSVATVAGPRGRPVTVAVTARVERLAVGCDGAPSASSCAYGAVLLSDGDILLSGTTDVVPDPFSSSGVWVHTNGDYSIKSQPTVDGHVTYAGAASGNGPRGSEAKSGPVLFPDLDLDALARVYGVDHDLGPTAFHGRTLAGGPRGHPVVYRVRGDLSLRDVVVDGYAVFLVDGDLDVEGRVVGPSGAEYDESRLALYTAGNFTVNGNTEVHAQIVAEGSFFYSGTIEIAGTLAVRSGLDLRGTATVAHRPAAPSLTRGQGKRVLVVTAYSEH